MTAYKVEKEIGGRRLTIESGRLARQAHGAVTVRYGDSVALVAAVSGPPRPGIDFFPLTVEYREKVYAAGKIPGNVFRREARPTLKEVLTSRLIDRPIRPLFPDNFHDEVQVMATVLSSDLETDTDIIGIIGASAALAISPIPFEKPIGAVRVGRIDGQFVVNPTYAQRETSDLDLVIAGTKEAVLMVEAGARELTEDEMIGAIEFGHTIIREVVVLIEDLVTQCGAPKKKVPVVANPMAPVIRKQHGGEIRRLSQGPEKGERNQGLVDLLKSICEGLGKEEGGAENIPLARAAFHEIERESVRSLILEGKRADGRGARDVRPISGEVGILPRTHGSAVFTRGETQALVVATLGTTFDVLTIGVDDLREKADTAKRFILHYNFPSFCVGEVRPIRGPGRREIGHGALAERSLEAVVPSEEKFPYTVRVVSDILESNGSSSMATVCGGTLSLMDAGVPIRQPVAGVAMGLVKEGDRTVVLTDILGSEDHHGDMDFKVAGTQFGITGLQMDIKVSGITTELMREALGQAREARLHILKEMLKILSRPRESISTYAPRLIQIKVPTDKIGMIIGPGGKNIRRLQEETGTKIDINDEGVVSISGLSDESVARARSYVEGVTEEAEVGKVYKGRVTSIKDFGVFVEILPGKEGLVHVSELADGYVEKPGDVVREGEEIEVKCLAVDDSGKIRLSRKAVGKPDAAPGDASAMPRPSRPRGDRNGNRGEGSSHRRRDHLSQR
ncbi:MAG: polyribonucleotide nucleotidyltransferase [Planctomycetota bacterium]